VTKKRKRGGKRIAGCSAIHSLVHKRSTKEHIKKKNCMKEIYQNFPSIACKADRQQGEASAVSGAFK
jgi:hypothetical protein